MEQGVWIVGFGWVVTTIALLNLPLSYIPAIRGTIDNSRLPWNGFPNTGRGVFACACSGLIAIWLFCGMVLVGDYARLHHTSWLGHVLAVSMSMNGAFGAVLAFGILLYFIRIRYLIVYGMIETVAAGTVLWFSLPPATDDLTKNATTLVACIYFLFRGLDNIRLASEWRGDG